MVASPVKDEDAQQGRLVGFAPQSSPAARARAGDLDSDRYNSKDDPQGRDRRYLRALDEVPHRPISAEDEDKSYEGGAWHPYATAGAGTTGAYPYANTTGYQRPGTLSTSATLTTRIQLAEWLKRREGTWGLPRRRNVNPVSRSIYRQMSYGPHLDFSLLNFFKTILRSEPLV